MGNSIELDLTVLRPGRRRSGVDVRVTAPAGTTFEALLPLLLDAVGATGVGPEGVGHDRVGAGTARVTCHGAAVAPGAVVGMPPLVHGGTLVLDEPARPTPRTAAPIDLVVVAGPDAGRRHALTPYGVVVGRSAGIGLSLDDDRLSRRHVSITPLDNGFRVTDLSSTNGTRCGDAVLAHGSATAGGIAAAGRIAPSAPGEGRVAGGELIAIGSSLLRLVRSSEALAPTRSRGDGRVAVNRAPRTIPPASATTVTAPTPPAPPRRARVPWLAAALPLPFAGALALVFGPQMLAFALLSPLMVVGNVLADRVGSRRDHAREVAAHDVELSQRQDEFADLCELERQQRWRSVPDAATVLAIASGPGARLWERRRSAPDFGRVRVGVGELASHTGWSPPGAAPVEHPLLPDLPVEVDLADVGGLGVAGPPDEVEAVVRHVLGQVAALHSPRDVRLIVHSAGPGCPLSWARWLPHTTAYADLGSCLDALREVVTTREDDGERHGSEVHPLVLVVLGECEIDVDMGELHDLLDRGAGVGVRCLVGARLPGALPGSCQAVVGLGQGAGDGTARLDVDGEEPVVAFTADLVGWWWGERLGRALAPLVDGSVGGEVVPDSVHLMDLVPWLRDRSAVTEGRAPAEARVVRHWRGGGGRPLAHLGGVAGAVWSIDLATDGPHVLVGGTTGSGKSELLRTLVTSLALECSPDDVSFVLVDYKGGAAFGECAQLPHTVGLVTNLDDGLARRALVSLGAEITRREELLAASGARDFDDHRRRGERLPRLVLVIDEFRLLAEELPDFVDGVVSLAAVGRSLGLHLVLATQRPAGAVTADIQANVNLRIAMRVRDVADSHDVIGAADAARISPDRPGRGFARGGDGDLVEFQAARVGGADATSAVRLEVLDHTGAPAATTVAQPPDGADEHRRPASGPAEVATLLRAAARAAGLPEPHRPWLPPLAEHLGAAEVGVDGAGLVDLPGSQRQEVLRHLPGEGHWLLVGGPRSGRTTALRTIIGAHVAVPGSSTHVHVIDTRGDLTDLEDLPQVGAVVHAHDVGRTRRLLARLRDASAGHRTPSAPVLLAIDGWERLDADGELALGGLRDDILDLLRAGSAGVRAVVTGDRSLLSSRLGSVASETFLLPLADPADATYAGLSRRDLPSSGAPGRALRLRDRSEVQFARRDPLAEAAPRDPAAPAPLVVPRLPERVEHGALVAASTTGTTSELLTVGLSADTGSTAHLDPTRHGRRLLVAGHPRSGRSTTLATVGASAVLAGRTVAVVETTGGSVATTVEAAAAGIRVSEGPDGTTGPGGVIRVDPWDGEALEAARRRCPDLVVLVDDADRIDATPVEPLLLEIAALVDRDGGLVVAAATVTAVTAQFRGLLPAIARAQSGVLLAPRTPGDGEGFGIRAPRGIPAVPGRALLVSGRDAHEVQIAQVRLDGSESARPPVPVERRRPPVRCA